MKNSIALLGFGLALAATPLISGCSLDSQEAEAGIGQAELLLQGTATSGTVYRLIDPEFEIRGPSNLVYYPAEDATSFQVDLPAGSYEIELNAGWGLGRVEGDGSVTPVTATLVSANPQPFMISNGVTTHLQFQFETDAGSVVLGDGALDVTIGVNETNILRLADFESPSVSNVASELSPLQSDVTFVNDGTAPEGVTYAHSAIAPTGAGWGGIFFNFQEPLSLLEHATVSFYYRSTGDLFVGFDTVETVPAPAGTCTGSCFDGFGSTLPASPSWQYVEIPLSNFAQGGWGVVAPSGLVDPIDMYFSNQEPNTFDIDDVRIQ